MSVKNSTTISDFIPWNDLQNLILKLERDDHQKMALLVAIGAFTGLRVGDILSLTWGDIKPDLWSIREQKTKKLRKVTINQQLRDILNRNKAGATGLVFVNKNGKQPISIQYVNTELKRIAKRYSITGRISSHSLRKSFGRNVWEKNGKSDKALIMLSQVFGHQSTQVTRIYLGLREEEIANIYFNL
jgi:integrase